MHMQTAEALETYTCDCEHINSSKQKPFRGESPQTTLKNRENFGKHCEMANKL